MSHNIIKVITDKKEKLIQVLQELFELYSQQDSSVNFKLYHNKNYYLIELEEGTEFDYLCFLVNYIRWAELDELYDQKSIVGYWKTYYKHHRIGHEIGEVLNVYVTKNDQNFDNVSICNQLSETWLYDFGGKVTDQEDDGFEFEKMDYSPLKTEFIKEFYQKKKKVKPFVEEQSEYLKLGVIQILNLYFLAITLTLGGLLNVSFIAYNYITEEQFVENRGQTILGFSILLILLGTLSYFYSKSRIKFKTINVSINDKELEKVISLCQEEYKWSYTKRNVGDYFIRAHTHLGYARQDIYIQNEVKQIKFLSIMNDCRPNIYLGRSKRDLENFKSVLKKELNLKEL